MDITFTEQKETKGTVMFLEDGYDRANPDASVIGPLYVRKAALPALGLNGSPRRLTVSVTAAKNGKK